MTKRRRRRCPVSTIGGQNLTRILAFVSTFPLLLLLGQVNAAAAFHSRSIAPVDTPRYNNHQHHQIRSTIVLRDVDEVEAYIKQSSREHTRQRNSTMNIFDRIFTSLHKGLWSALTTIGTRNIIPLIRLLPWYRDTIFYFYLPESNSSEENEKMIVLTIDDGLSQGGSDTSMVPEVMSVLERYNTHATFFVCSDYCIADKGMKEATYDLVHTHGHEIGNHMKEDRSGYYSRLSEDEFRIEFEGTNKVVKELISIKDAGSGENVSKDSKPKAIRWFRAPQGVLTPKMRRVITSRDITHVLGDVYCDDWALACKDAKFVCDTMLRQVKEGSVVIMHMPEKSTDREAILDILERFLRETTTRGYKVVSLSEMTEACCNRHAHL